MIHYALRCGRGHGFDGWFRHSDAFEAQATNGSLVCPTCADRAIRRAPMAPKIGRHGAAEVTPAPGHAPEAMPDGGRALLQRMRAEVERRCDYVGPAFAETVRAMHEGEAPVRDVYGEASAMRRRRCGRTGPKLQPYHGSNEPTLRARSRMLLGWPSGVPWLRSDAHGQTAAPLWCSHRHAS